MTRAKESLALTRARTRLTWGVARQMEASRFLDEIPDDLRKDVRVAAAAFQSSSSRAVVVAADPTGPGSKFAYVYPRSPRRRVPSGPWSSLAAALAGDDASLFLRPPQRRRLRKTGFL